MQQAADQWIDRFAWHNSGARLMSEVELRDLLRSAYLAGYEAGRA